MDRSTLTASVSSVMLIACRIEAGLGATYSRRYSLAHWDAKTVSAAIHSSNSPTRLISRLHSGARHPERRERVASNSYALFRQAKGLANRSPRYTDQGAGRQPLASQRPSDVRVVLRSRGYAEPSRPRRSPHCAEIPCWLGILVGRSLANSNNNGQIRYRRNPLTASVASEQGFLCNIPPRAEHHAHQPGGDRFP